jgi:hypothetical protein
MTKDPEGRPPRAGAMAYVLARAAESVPVEVRAAVPPPPTVRAASAPSLLDDQDQEDGAAIPDPRDVLFKPPAPPPLPVVPAPLDSYTVPSGDTPYQPPAATMPRVAPPATVSTEAITRASVPTLPLKKSGGSETVVAGPREVRIRVSLLWLIVAIVLAGGALIAVLVGLRTVAPGVVGVTPTAPPAVVITLPPFAPLIGIDAPLDGAAVRGVFPLYGSAYTPESFAYYTVEIGEGEEPSGWSIVRDQVPYAVQHNVLADVDVRSFPPGPVTIRLTVMDGYGRSVQRRVTVVVAP